MIRGEEVRWEEEARGEVEEKDLEVVEEGLEVVEGGLEVVDDGLLSSSSLSNSPELVLLMVSLSSSNQAP